MSDTPKFLLDENIPKLLKRFFESNGLEAEYAPKGTKNGVLASLALERELVLLTRDSDFLNPRLFPPKQFSGIVVFRIDPPLKEKLLKGAGLLLDKVKDFKGRLFIVGEGEIEVVEE